MRNLDEMELEQFCNNVNKITRRQFGPPSGHSILKAVAINPEFSDPTTKGAYDEKPIDLTRYL